MKQTAVEWLGFELNLRLFDKVSEKEWEEINEVFKKALAMEREQIEDAYDQDLYGGLSKHRIFDNGKQYYNETYKGGEQ